MLEKIIQYSIHHKLIVLLFTAGIVGFGFYALSNIPIGAVPDVTNNQVQVITTSRNLATEDVEKFLTYPVELEMANLPGVKEIRSVSKFGLSVVTVVFDDKIGTYLPRQLIAEKIKSAQEKIPAGFGTPFMGPVSTGLGEIYQYIINVDPKYKNKYSLSDIRTIQDWIVKRQLSGIPGVVEVNTWGGHLKQYEVAINPESLRAMNISIFDAFNALEKNNSIAGGGYIEKGNESYFIRGEGLVNSLEDIENIVVTTRDNVPVYIKDIASVGFGNANRFGAITGNGEGEKVLGQVMMLKDANSNAVINAVKDRVSEIQSSLPPGISINPFLERSELIAKTTFTIAENLILGCLIVIFVVVLLLGNIRSGLVVASVIPLCLMFALSMMYIFGVDANLMSLGAIDFGIIIDGAVIIVEFIAFKITGQRVALLALPKNEQQGLIDKITFQGATKMMKSAVFGQLIIIIVFIPILSLVNVEGKMFKPMALVFCFALIGAMVLCFTYIPVMASLFIKPSNVEKRTISSRLIAFLENKYKPTISWALRQKKLVLSLSVLLLFLTAFLYSRMGGEFVPTLDEGDFVIQPVLKTGTSLTKTVEATTRMENILLKFPEVEQVVSRIGAAEVPTDPMSMEESDVIIKLKPKSEWVSAQSKDELADKFKEALSEIPGIDYEFTQPIEMRFNELITGVRADLAIKIFGEDLDILYKKALEVEKAIQNVEGAADISVEKTAGLPQMTVKYNRNNIAKYGLNIEDLNKIITMGFAGMPAGTVFEGEKQFDLVVRYDEKHRKDIQNIETASVLLPNGNNLPLSEFAKISYTKGPAKISRDNTKRRIVIGVNVRNRDLESVVKDVQQIINTEIKLPTAYTVSYGGQFENLRTASARLKIAVPIALVLIFVLLYFAFDSVKEALIIYSAIPLSAIGGVLLLYFRDLPFSISAGVGFIALFGIAVLNGIVLIEEFKELKAHGISNINKRILMGTNNRLRPVLLTAAAAALGFLPMAISTSAGAEVQRPLATVVVGGLISATALTLVVLPVLYAMFDRKGKKIKIKNKALPLLVFLLLPFFAMSQTKEISADQAVEIALKNNNMLKASVNRVNQSKQLIGSAFNIDKTQVYYQYDENNLAENGQPLKVFGISQSIQFPTIYGSQRKAEKQKTKLSFQEYNMNERLLKKEVYSAYYSVVYNMNVVTHYQYLDSLYQQFSNAATKRYDVGETNLLEKLMAETKQKEVSLLLSQSLENVNKANTTLQEWLQSDSTYVVSKQTAPLLPLKEWNLLEHPGLLYYETAKQLSQTNFSIEKQQLLPDLQFSVFQGTNNGMNAKNYSGFQAGVSIPLWFGANKSKINAAKTQTMIIENNYENYKIQLESKYKRLFSDLKKHEEAINYYNNKGQQLSRELTLTASKAFKNGEINFLQYVQLLESATTININYLKDLFNYNTTILELNYLTY
ncbi:MAG: CusA/CzcA family heavy metal efflux RND transporter [Flavobacteriales bacterium]|nr:CusA/CzcA family heavy metal efflux RND transporter [Flavobacteriales bacterium]PIV93671.1 MAG: CusA/CzcA family heavy metal efflux RND transporter [Flavobacteriaceae bacterium CG17_big_fil_post_rev_8_21_14_2_50_33_15]PIY13349.1 MAG: CusA/CzcA family heavy metal efflux RND transporter [Flavobacteriaceae bacterium CG_4_10_14_3_um_filter_33_47]PJB17743.1 MAG: CusA/CzcA family heavy metal efflux RND transporter [Flavobacteriaceae bacterium CG_4_9_14_3_um_filter_33_16]NCP51563.1 CusA/CzcA family